ncbi:unnamed protein product [Orchesella dallaii]|uniref:Uncharacterized protein n=1 Tax=Orchesella dallaii TaxID=48710 RepID=A0ABP1RWH0_9HEXA
MKHFLTAATVAVLALVVFEIAQTDAQRRCPARDKPPLVNATSVRCDRWQGIIIAPLSCARRCLDCYEREKLQRSCYVNRRCTCIAKPVNSTTTTQAPTTQAPTTQAPTTQAPTTQAPTTQAPITEAPTTQAPITEAPTTQAATTEAPLPTTSSEPEPIT